MRGGGRTARALGIAAGAVLAAVAAVVVAVAAPVLAARAGGDAAGASSGAPRLAGAASGTASGTASGAASIPQAAVRVVDDWQRAVELPRAPRRIVSLAPHATELLFAAGAGAQVVAVDRSSDHPPQARALPALAAHPRPDPERLLALRPDLVVLWGASADRGFVDRLAALGLAVFVSEPRSLEDVSSTLERFGLLAPSPGLGREEARLLREAVAALRARHAQREPVPVFVQVWSRPLITLSDHDAFADVLRTCGARNVFGGERVPAPQVGAEAVIRRAPRLVIAFGDRADEARGPWERLGLLAPRGRADFVAVDDAIQRPTPRLLGPMTKLCGAIESARATSIAPAQVPHGGMQAGLAR